MEILLIACMLAYAAGAQSEQSKLGISPAQRAILREKTRHERAVRKIADKHGTKPIDPGVSPWKEPATTAAPLTVPEAFRAGYRGHTPVARVTTPLGRHAGTWTAKGIHWAKDTGRTALTEYRKRRKAAGDPDPDPVFEPVSMPPTPADPPSDSEAVTPPGAPPMPTTPPTVPPAEADDTETPWWDWEYDETDRSEDPPESTAEDPPPVPSPRSDAPIATVTDIGAARTTTDNSGGAGRMAAEVSYDSVMDESDELSLMCDDDVKVYGRIRQRCEREIGRADALIAQLESVGAGATVIGWVTRCREQYQVIYGQLDDLERNTLSQAEAVTKAKALLEAGQGLYADIAADMESVAERDFYTSDAVDGEDTSADTEIYETQGARA